MTYIIHMTYASRSYISCVGYKNTLHKMLTKKLFF